MKNREGNTFLYLGNWPVSVDFIHFVAESKRDRGYSSYICTCIHPEVLNKSNSKEKKQQIFYIPSKYAKISEFWLPLYTCRSLSEIK